MRVDHDRDDEEDRPISIERGQIQVVGRLGELVGDDRRHRVLRGEERGETWGLLPMTIVTAIVSPSARPKPSMIAPRTPVRP